jgi:hypothetical protein
MLKDVAFSDVHVNVEDWPLYIETGLAVSEAIGGGAVVTVTVAAAVTVPLLPLTVIV